MTLAALRLGFWSGYALWLRAHRTHLFVAGLLVVIGLVLGLWVTQSPEDPFVYDIG